MNETKRIYQAFTERVDAHGSTAYCKEAEITLDTDVNNRDDAFNPAELLLAALSACIIKEIERVTPILKFELHGVEVRVTGVRQESPPKMESIHYEIFVDCDESEHRFKLLHDNVKKFGTVFNTLVSGTQLGGVLRRAE
jgi:uncharacterized OsmC-like protein